MGGRFVDVHYEKRPVDEFSFSSIFNTNNSFITHGGSLDSWCCECSSLLVFNGMCFFPRFILDTTGQSFPLVPQSCWCGNLSVRRSQYNPVEAWNEGYRWSNAVGWDEEFHRCSESSRISCWLISWLFNNYKRNQLWKARLYTDFWLSEACGQI